jgi:putative transcriptional regulator
MKKADFQELMKSVKQGAQILKGESKPSRIFDYPDPKIRELRTKYGLSQPVFATLMGISVGTLRNWEQGRRRPEGPAQVLLQVVARYPREVFRISQSIHRVKHA